jgi:hypothetical protein
MSGAADAADKRFTPRMRESRAPLPRGAPR